MSGRQDAPRRPGSTRRRLLLAALLASAALLALALAPADSPPGAPVAGTQDGGQEAVKGAPAPVPPLPACTFGDQPARLAGANTLLDTYWALPADFVPSQLVPLDQALAHTAPGQFVAPSDQQLQQAAAAALALLFEAAEAAGVRLAVQSAYRSFAYQESTFAYWVEVDGYEAALATSARPGHSEHQLGTVIDLRSRSGPAAWDLADWADTAEGAWVAANAHQYGFVMSYPRGRQADSCYSYEPWHYRYVGTELARLIYESGVTPRALLWSLQQQALAHPEGEREP